MAKQKQSKSFARRAYDRASRFTTDHRRSLSMVGAGIATAGAVLLGRRYRDRRAADAWPAAAEPVPAS